MSCDKYVLAQDITFSSTIKYNKKDLYWQICINDNLEQQAQAIFKEWFIDNMHIYKKLPLADVVSKANVGGDANVINLSTI